MTRRPIEELVIGYARGEPMDVEELERLRAESAASAAVASDLRNQQELTRRLAALRNAMRLPEGALDDDSFLESFRAAHARRTTSRRRLRLGAGAAGIAASVAAVAVVATLDRMNQDVSVGLADTDVPASSLGGNAASTLPAWAVFHPLPFSPGVSPGASYSVVRVRIPVSSFPVGYTAEPYASVEADLLLGPDGIPAAIRFVDPDEVFVTAAADLKER